MQENIVQQVVDFILRIKGGDCFSSEPIHSLNPRTFGKRSEISLITGVVKNDHLVRSLREGEQFANECPEGAILEVKKTDAKGVVLFYYLVSRGMFRPLVKDGPFATKRAVKPVKHSPKREQEKEVDATSKPVRPSKITIFDRNREETRGAGCRVVSEKVLKSIQRTKMPRTYTIQGEIAGSRRRREYE